MRCWVLCLAALATVVAGQAGGEGCLRWCRHVHSPTEYYCCRADPAARTHYGKCPSNLASNAMTTYCWDDRHCQAYEKCCYSTYSKRSTCAAAVTNRRQPKPAVSSRFGGRPRDTAINFGDSFYRRTYSGGNEGWGSMGKMEHIN